jgi:hypothetical protein
VVPDEAQPGAKNELWDSIKSLMPGNKKKVEEKAGR